jgi:hypothetical protein
MARRLLFSRGSAKERRFVGALAMVLAVAAASLALDAIQSLTSPQPQPSQPFGFQPALPDAGDGSAGSQAASSGVSGFGGTQISSNNISALLDAQSLNSANFANSIDPGSANSDQSSNQQASGTASSAYNTINQLTQSHAIPLGISPFSVSA